MRITPNPAGGLPGDPETIRELLRSPETKRILSSLQSCDPVRLRAAADQALHGKDAPLQEILHELSRDPETFRAMEGLDRALKDR